MRSRNVMRASICFAICLVITVLASNGGAQSEVETEQLRNVAVIDIAAPRMSSLLQLRGLAGSGKVFFRVNGVCSTMRVRFVAGDFEGRNPKAQQSGPIQILIYASDVIERLRKGQDIVSGEMHVSTDLEDPIADLLLVRGLSEETGFVINPGRSVIADVFGVRPSAMSCSDAPVEG